jgi:hypothetical protein
MEDEDEDTGGKTEDAGSETEDAVGDAVINVGIVCGGE